VDRRKEQLLSFLVIHLRVQFNALQKRHQGMTYFSPSNHQPSSHRHGRTYDSYNSSPTQERKEGVSALVTRGGQSLQFRWLVENDVHCLGHASRIQAEMDPQLNDCRGRTSASHERNEIRTRKRDTRIDEKRRTSPMHNSINIAHVCKLSSLHSHC
jgi:hypothetical protein